jgi:hypothetical protein
MSKNKEIKANKKITKLSDLNMIHGKIEREEPTTIEQILGKTYNMAKYKTDDLKEYLSELDNLNVAELRTHALTLGAFIPNQDRNKLIKQLEREFTKYHAVYKKPKIIHNDTDLLKTKKGKAALEALKKAVN